MYIWQGISRLISPYHVVEMEAKRSSNPTLDTIFTDFHFFYLNALCSPTFFLNNNNLQQTTQYIWGWPKNRLKSHARCLIKEVKLVKRNCYCYRKITVKYKVRYIRNMAIPLPASCDNIITENLTICTSTDRARDTGSKVLFTHYPTVAPPSEGSLYTKWRTNDELSSLFGRQGKESGYIPPVSTTGPTSPTRPSEGFWSHAWTNIGRSRTT